MKDRSVELFLILFGLLIIVILAFGAVEANGQSLPDNPEVQKKQCYQGNIEQDGKFSYRQIPCSEVPSINEYREVKVVDDNGKITFFKFRPIRSNSQTLKSRWFIIPHVLAVGLAIAEVKRAKGYPPGSYVDALVPVGAISGIDYITDRFIWRPFSLVAVGYVIGHDGYGAVTRNYQ
jgi:hypothetical protein